MTVHPSETLDHLRRREDARQARIRHMVAELQPRLHRAARVLRDRFGARRVLLVGSLATGRAGLDSDVDLAVEGLETLDYHHAHAAAWEVLERPVDLVEIERASPSMLARIAAEGVEL